MFTNICGILGHDGTDPDPCELARDSEHPAETAIAVYGANIFVTGGQPTGLTEGQLDLDRTLFLQLLVDGVDVQGPICDDG